MADEKNPPRKEEGPGSPGPQSPQPAPQAPSEKGPQTAESEDQETQVHGVEFEHDELKHLRARLKKKEGENRSLKKERDELRDQLLRRLADMDNLKKRLDREKADFLQYALTDFLKTLLPILDNLERAMERAEEGDGPSLQEGIRLIHKQFLDALRKQGVSPISDVLHQKFDPTFHHALATEESDEIEEPQVIEELQRGYMLHDRLLRPALVRVRLPKKTKA